MGKNRKKGSRAFTPAVSKEKNDMIVNNFISSVIIGKLSESIKLGSVNKSLGDARWEILYYNKNSKNEFIANTVQCIKAGNLSRRGAFISSGSIVIIDDIGSNMYQIVGVMSKDDIREFKKINSDMVPEKLFNVDATDNDDTEDNNIIFEEAYSEEETKVEEKKVPYKRKNVINKDVIVDNDDDEVIIDDI